MEAMTYQQLTEHAAFLESVIKRNDQTIFWMQHDYDVLKAAYERQAEQITRMREENELQAKIIKALAAEKQTI
jgi:hypothetical protein